MKTRSMALLAGLAGIISFGATLSAQQAAAWMPELASAPAGGIAPGDGTTPDTMVLWRFDEGEGDTAHDLGAAKADLKLQNMGWTDGKFGKAVALDASKKSMGSLAARWIKYQKPNPSPFAAALKAVTPSTEGWTFSAILRSNAVSGVAFEQPNGTYSPGNIALMLDNGKTRMSLIQVKGCSYGRALLETKTQFNDGKWHHIALVCNGKELELWIDGVQDNRMNLPNSPVPSGEDFVIGCTRAFQDPAGRYAPGSWWTGDIDEIRIEKGAQSDFSRVRKLFLPEN